MKKLEGVKTNVPLFLKYKRIVGVISMDKNCQIQSHHLRESKRPSTEDHGLCWPLTKAVTLQDDCYACCVI